MWSQLAALYLHTTYLGTRVQRRATATTSQLNRIGSEDQHSAVFKVAVHTVHNTFFSPN